MAAVMVNGLRKQPKSPHFLNQCIIGTMVGGAMVHEEINLNHPQESFTAT